MTDLKSIQLNGNSLESLPSTFGGLTALMNLRLYDNDLSVLPSSAFGKLTNLRHLGLANNRFNSIPTIIGELTGLRDLEFQENAITSAPDFLGRLTGLNTLLLNSNDISALSASILAALGPSSSSLNDQNQRLNLESNNISLAAMAVAFSGINLTPDEAPGTPTSLALFGANPGCTTTNGSLLASRVIGRWLIKCSAECAMRCWETGIGNIKSQLDNGRCNWQCASPTCGFDGDDCSL